MKVFSPTEASLKELQPVGRTHIGELCDRLDVMLKMPLGPGEEHQRSRDEVLQNYNSSHFPPPCVTCEDEGQGVRSAVDPGKNGLGRRWF